MRHSFIHRDVPLLSSSPPFSASVYVNFFVVRYFIIFTPFYPLLAQRWGLSIRPSFMFLESRENVEKSLLSTTRRLRVMCIVSSRRGEIKGHSLKNRGTRMQLNSFSLSFVPLSGCSVQNHKLKLRWWFE